jgi:uncharacterized protein YaaR (DUF327 family)
MKRERNAPCSCGSGKKYKDCCGKGNVVSLQAVMDEQLTECMHDLLWYATGEYADELLKAVGDTKQWERHGEIGEAINFFMMNWAIFCIPVTPKGETIVERYVRRRSSLWRPSIRSILSSWVGAVPSFDIVVEIQEERKFIIQDVLTSEKRAVRIFDSEPSPHVKKGDLLMGIIVPAGETYTYFTTFFSFPNMSAREIAHSLREMWKEHRMMNAREFLRTSFPSVWMAVVRSIMLFVEDSFEWEHPNYAEVAQELEKKMPYGAELDIAKMIWREYCDTYQPVIRSVPLHAAALHYIVCRVLRGEAVTQTNLASLYGVSVSSISKKVNDMMDHITYRFLSEMENEEYFSEEWDDEFADFDEEWHEAFWDEEEMDPMRELVESMFDKLVKTGYIFGKERNQQELDHLVNEVVREFFEVEENKTYDHQEIRAIAEKIIADLLD